MASLNGILNSTTHSAVEDAKIRDGLAALLPTIPQAPVAKDQFGSDTVPMLGPRSTFSMDMLSYWRRIARLNDQFQGYLLPRAPGLEVYIPDVVRLPNLPVASDVIGGADASALMFVAPDSHVKVDGTPISGTTLILHVPSSETMHCLAPYHATASMTHFMQGADEFPSAQMEVFLDELVRKMKDKESEMGEYTRLEVGRSKYTVPISVISGSIIDNTPVHALSAPIQVSLLQSEDVASEVGEAAVEGGGDGEAGEEGFADTHPWTVGSRVAGGEGHGGDGNGHAPGLADASDDDTDMLDDGEYETSDESPPTARPYDLRPRPVRSDSVDRMRLPPTAAPRFSSAWLAARSGIYNARHRRKLDLGHPKTSHSHVLPEGTRERLNKILDLPVWSWTDAEANMVSSVANTFTKSAVTGKGYGEYTTGLIAA